MARTVAEWIGKTDDSKVPDSVRLRIFRNAGGVCHLSGVEIKPGQPWDLEHVVPLSTVPGTNNSGLHRESNLRPALKWAHKEKTAREAEERAKADRVAKKNLGIEAPKAKIQSAGFRPKPDKKEAKRAYYHAIERRPMFRTTGAADQ